jgi:hypothetical protein
MCHEAMDIASIDALNDSNNAIIKDLEMQVKLFNGSPGLGVLEQALVTRQQMREDLILVGVSNGQLEARQAEAITHNIKGLAATASKIEQHAVSLYHMLTPEHMPNNLLGGVVAQAQQLNRDLHQVSLELALPTVEKPRPVMSSYSDVAEASANEPEVQSSTGHER